MKRLIFIFTMTIWANATFGYEIVTSCPSGYIEIKDKGMTVANGSCPANYVSGGNAQSCTVSTQGECQLFIPPDIEFQDGTGKYKFADVCIL